MEAERGRVQAVPKWCLWVTRKQLRCLSADIRMGGLLIADAVTRISESTRATDPLWPNVVATIAYDTPVSSVPIFGADISILAFIPYAICFSRMKS